MPSTDKLVTVNHEREGEREGEKENAREAEITRERERERETREGGGESEDVRMRRPPREGRGAATPRMHDRGLTPQVGVELRP